MSEICHIFYLEKKNLSKIILPIFVLVFTFATFVFTVNAIVHQSIFYTLFALFFAYMIYMGSFATYRIFKIGNPHLKITSDALYHEGIWKKSEYVKFIDIDSSDLKIHTIRGVSMCDLQLNTWDIQKQQKTGYGRYKEILRIRIFPECYKLIDVDFASWITVMKRMNIQQRHDIIQQWNAGVKPDLMQYFTEQELKSYQENRVVLLGNNIRLAFQHDAEQRN